MTNGIIITTKVLMFSPSGHTNFIAKVLDDLSIQWIGTGKSSGVTWDNSATDLRLIAASYTDTSSYSLYTDDNSTSITSVFGSKGSGYADGVRSATCTNIGDATTTVDAVISFYWPGVLYHDDYLIISYTPVLTTNISINYVSTS